MYNEARRYKTREHIRNEMIRELAQLWDYQEEELAIESFDPLVGMLLGAFATGIENVHHELDNSRGRIMSRLAQLLTPDVLTGPQPASAVMKVGILDPAFTVQPQHAFSANDKGKEFFFSPAGHYNLYKIKIQTVVTQSRIREMGPTPRDNYMNDTLPANEVWVGLQVDTDLDSFQNLNFFFDWRNDPARSNHVGQLAGMRLFTEKEELQVQPGLVNNEAPNAPWHQSDANQQIERATQRLYNPHFVSTSSNNRQTKQPVEIERLKYPQAVVPLLSTDELSKFFQHDLFWVKMAFSGGLMPEVLTRMSIETNAFPVVNRKRTVQTHDLRPLFNVFPLKIEDDEYFSGIIGVETQLGKQLHSTQQFSRDNAHQYLLRQGGVARFDERDASEMLSYLTDLLRDESAAFSALGRSELDTDIDEIRKRVERINNVIKKDNATNWFLTTKTTEKSGRISLSYWTTKAEMANNIALGAKLNRDRNEKAFTDDATLLLTTTQGGQKPIQGDDCLPAFKRALLTRGRVVTPEDYKAVCYAELAGKLDNVEVKKGFGTGETTSQGLQQTTDILLTPSGTYTAPPEQWLEHKTHLKRTLEAQSAGILPIRIFVNGLD